MVTSSYSEARPKESKKLKASRWENFHPQNTQLQAHFDELLRANYQKSLEAFSQLYLNEVAENFQLLRAVMYADQATQEGEHDFQPVASYGIGLHELAQKRVVAGEGVVGQVITDCKLRRFDDLPQGNQPVNAGSSQLHPVGMVVLPLHFNEEVYGAICLERLENFAPEDCTLLEHLARNLASTLQGILNNRRLRVLLEETRQQAEEISAREEEMRQNMEELTSTQEEMERIQNQLAEKHELVNTLIDQAPFGVLISEFETGQIKLANKRYADMLHISQEELLKRKTTDTYADVCEREELKQYIKEHGATHRYPVHLKRFDDETPFLAYYNLKIVQYEGKKHFFGAVIRADEEGLD
jgi:transcriptional regulator with GAF, ATPase, and Fis domain